MGRVPIEPDGSYLYSLLPLSADNQWYLEFLPDDPKYERQYWPGRPLLEGPQWIAGPDLALEVSRDAALPIGGQLGGTISGVDASTAVILNVTVEGWTGTSWKTVAGVVLQDTGDYTVGSLGPGHYRFRSKYRGPEGYAELLSAPVDIIAGSTVEWSPTLRPQTRDFSGDWLPDVLGRGATGNLVMYRTTSGFQFQPGSSIIATGWGGYTAMTHAGDLDGDGRADLVVRDAAGALWLFPGKAGGGISPRKPMATGWKSYTRIMAPGDMDGDGADDLLTADASGRLWLHPGDGSGQLGSRVPAASGFTGATAFVAPGDVDYDGHPDLIVRDRAGVLWLYRGVVGATYSTSRTKISSGWQNATAIFSVGDAGGDGPIDLLARGATGKLYQYFGDGKGGFSAGFFVNAGWQKATFVL
jgi:hypothetical protein